MIIYPETPQRDNYGAWCHSAMAFFRGKEAVNKRDVLNFERHYRVMVQIVNFYEVVSDDSALMATYARSGRFGGWKPVAPRADAFLLAVSDSDNGPVAWWAVPVVVSQNDYAHC
jgi:hypothetical protein